MKGLSKLFSLLPKNQTLCGLSVFVGVLSSFVAVSAQAQASPAGKLWSALVHGDLMQTSALLAQGVDPNVRDSRGTPLLVSAISLVHQDCRETLLLRGIELLLRDARTQVDLKDRAYIGDDRAALHMAAAGGCIKVVEMLLNRGAKLSLGNRFNETPLHLAAERGHAPIVHLLMSRGADMRLMTKHTRMNPLMLAAQSGHAASIKVMLRTLLGGDVMQVLNARDTFGNSSLDLAKKFTLKAPTLSQRASAHETLRLIEFARLRVSAQALRIPAHQNTL